MTSSNDLNRMAVEIRAAAEECGTMILETIIPFDDLPVMVVDGATFPVLIKHLRPRLIYMILTEFDANDEVASHFDEEDLDRDLRKLASQWKGKNGQSVRLVVGLMSDGILHGIVETAEWYEQFEADADELVPARQQAISDAFAQMQRVDAEEREAKERGLLAPMVSALLADARFNAPKVSAAKRLALAEALFPHEDRSTLRKAVDRAATGLWLADAPK